MKSLPRIISYSVICISPLLFTSCAEDLDYFFNGPPNGTYQATGSSNDSWSAQQNAAREANMRAVQQQQYNNNMNSYQRGYTNTLPNIPSY